jgi:hypothetical protein
MASEHTPKSITIRDGGAFAPVDYVANREFPASWTSMCSLEKSNVENLEIWVTPDSLRWSAELFRQLHTAPRLAVLKLYLHRCDRGVSFTSFVTTICGLLKNGKLHTFSLVTVLSRRIELNPFPLLTTFMDNPSVKKFTLELPKELSKEFEYLGNILKSKNTVLEDVRIVGGNTIHHTDTEGGYFWYLTMLNKYGRGKARNCQTTLEELVHLFVTAKNASDEHKAVQLGLLYDLLLESTSKWSSAVVMYHSRGTSRKRKAIAV